IDGGGAGALPTELQTVGTVSGVPPLRLVTGGSAAETRVSGARAGRAAAVELLLPEEPTVSRVHAKFVFRDGQWRVTGLGRNGLMVNEKAGRGGQGGRGGGLIRRGNQPGAPGVRVQIRPAQGGPRACLLSRSRPGPCPRPARSVRPVPPATRSRGGIVMPGTVAVALIVLAVIPLAVWAYRSNFLLHVAGADPQYIQTAPDRAR